MSDKFLGFKFVRNCKFKRFLHLHAIRTPAAPAPAPVPATPAPAPAMPEVPSRAVPEVSQGPNFKQMTMDEFQQKREQLLHQLEAEFGNK